MAFIEGTLIKQMLLLLCVTVREVLSFSASNAAILSLRLYGSDTLRLKISRSKIKASFLSYGFLSSAFQESLAEFSRKSDG